MPFQPGQSGNPAGKPKGTKNFTTKVRLALEKIADGTENTEEQELIKTILKKARVEGDSQMIKLIWNYLDGMPQQNIDHTTDGKPIYLPSEVINKENGNSEKN